MVVGWLRDPEGPVHAVFTGQADELARLAEALNPGLLLKYDCPSLKADFSLTAGKANKLAAAIEALAAHDRLEPQPGGSGALSEAEEAALMAEADSEQLKYLLLSREQQGMSDLVFRVYTRTSNLSPSSKLRTLGDQRRNEERAPPYRSSRRRLPFSTASRRREANAPARAAGVLRGLS